MQTTAKTVVLVPGHWLGSWAWDAVAAPLRDRGLDVIAVTLPGLDPADPDRTSRTVADQADHLQAVVAGVGESVVLVVHSGAAFPATVLLDRDPTTVRHVVYVDSGPSADGAAFDDTLPAEVQEVALPEFDVLDASTDGLGEDDLERFRSRAVPEPASVMREHLRLTDDARRDVASTIVACSFPSEVVMHLATSGNPMMAEVALLRNLDLVDLPTGHWPMWSRPTDLADVIVRIAAG